MQKLSIVLSAALFAAFFLAPTTISAEESDPGVAFCGSMGELAEAVMTIRQSGVAMSLAMSVATANEALKEVATKLIIAAYDTPQFSVEENRKDAAMRFRNDFEVECFKGLVE